MLYNISTVLLLFLCKILFKLEIKGKDVLPKRAPFIIAANHTSNLDPIALGVSAFPFKVRFLAKEELFKNKLFGFILRNLGVIPLKRSSKDISALRSALRILKREVMAIFPQGTRSASLDKVNTGVAFLQKKSGVPVIAARIYGTDEILPRGAIFLKKGRIKVVFDRVDRIEAGDSYENIALKILGKIKSL